MSKVSTVPILSPSKVVNISATSIDTGLPIPPIERIKLFSHDQWEEFLLEWVDSLREKYSVVERCGSAGDMGRDVIAIDKEDTALWDNYQCKHYDNPLTPSKVWIEFGKLIYYTFKGEYTYPRKYYFVAPQGVGTKLSNLLRKPDILRSELLKNWNQYCRSELTQMETVELSEELSRYIDNLDFSIFESIPPLRIIDGHAKTRWYTARFGGGLPERPPIEVPPQKPDNAEAVYTKQLFDAYGEYLAKKVFSIGDLDGENDIKEHFDDSRIEFYSAESLRTFSRDTLPPNEFEKLQKEIHSGIKDEIREPHPDGYRRVLSVVKTARNLQLTSHPLITRLTVEDRGGICHQLANDKKVRWVR